jgi:signal transduction histidine kinase
MRLRAKFTLLSLFILSLPLLAIVLAFYMQRLVTGSRPGERLHGGANERIVADFIRTQDPTLVRGRIPRRMQITIVDADGIVAASTESGVGRGDAFSIGRLAEPGAASGPAPHYVFDAISVEGSPYTVVTRLPNLPRLIYEGWLPALLFFPIAMILGTALLSTVMLRRTTKSLLVLKEASARLASGDLDSTWTVSQKDEIGELSDSFNSMRLSLKEETERKSRFLMAVTHDLRTPLTSIKGYLEAFADGLGEDSESRGKYISILRDRAALLEGRINELLDFVKMETGEWKLKQGRLQLAPFLREIGASFMEDAGIAEREFETRIEVPEELSVSADQGLLSRVLENLVHNAFRYTEKGDRVTLSAWEDAGITIEVKDSGRGIAPDERVRIFQPFYRGTRSRNEPGFGLGLSIVKSIVEAHGWSIGLEGAGGQTAFRIRIPASGSGIPRN